MKFRVPRKAIIVICAGYAFYMLRHSFRNLYNHQDCTRRIQGVDSDVQRDHVYYDVKRESDVVLAVALCGLHAQEGINMLKSAIIFSPGTVIDVHVFYDDVSFNYLVAKLPKIKTLANKFGVTLSFTLNRATFPDTDVVLPWRDEFRPCSAQRLFLSSMLTKVDAVIYLDSDAIILTDLRHLWRYFSYMNNTQLAAMTWHDEPHGAGYYPNHPNKIPYYGVRGVQAGVMLQNLTRMRSVNFHKHMDPIYQDFEQKLTLFDQDILNIYFSRKPEQMLILPCEWNYIITHCNRNHGRGRCIAAEMHGTLILHGAGGTFESATLGFFSKTYRLINETNLEIQNAITLSRSIYESYKMLNASDPCADLSPSIWTQILKFVNARNST